VKSESEAECFRMYLYTAFSSESSYD